MVDEGMLNPVSMLGDVVFRSRVKLYGRAGSFKDRNLVLSTLTKGGHPVKITNYDPSEKLIIDVPMTVVQSGSTCNAALAENGLDLVIRVAGHPIVILDDFDDLDAVDLRFVAKSFRDDNALFDGQRLYAADDEVVIEDSDQMVVVNKFDLHTDKLEIGAGRAFQLEDAHDCSGTVVVVDGEPIFLLPGILPSQMAGALVKTSASG